MLGILPLDNRAFYHHSFSVFCLAGCQPFVPRLCSVMLTFGRTPKVTFFVHSPLIWSLHGLRDLFPDRLLPLRTFPLEEFSHRCASAILEQERTVASHFHLLQTNLHGFKDKICLPTKTNRTEQENREIQKLLIERKATLEHHRLDHEKRRLAG